MTSQPLGAAQLHALTHATIRSFEPGYGLYENTRTGRRMTDGVITFETCGHSYHWYPWGLQDDEPMPAAGGTAGCAMCLENLLAAQTPEAK